MSDTRGNKERDIDAEMEAMMAADARAGGELQLVPESMLWLALQGWNLARPHAIGAVPDLPKPWHERIGKKEGVPEGVMRFAMLEEIADLRAQLAAKSGGADAEALNAAVDAEYPVPDNPHASVIQRATDNRAAMWRGINAARKILAAGAQPVVRAEVPAWRDHPAYLVACRMANVFYNLKQVDNVPQEWRDRASALVTEWDAARKAAPSPTQSGAQPQGESNA
jgi:hypothetical protein